MKFYSCVMSGICWILIEGGNIIVTNEFANLSFFKLTIIFVISIGIINSLFS